MVNACVLFWREMYLVRSPGDFSLMSFQQEQHVLSHLANTFRSCTVLAGVAYVRSLAVCFGQR